MRFLPTFLLVLILVFTNSFASEVRPKNFEDFLIQSEILDMEDLDEIFQLYTVSQSGSSKLVVFKGVYSVRVHTGNSYVPYQQLTTHDGYRLSVSKGQWCEIKVNGQWAFMSDVDNR